MPVLQERLALAVASARGTGESILTVIPAAGSKYAMVTLTHISAAARCWSCRGERFCMHYSLTRSVAGYRQSNALLRHFRPWLSHQPESELAGRLQSKSVRQQFMLWDMRRRKF
jgi:hypothetical protein